MTLVLIAITLPILMVGAHPCTTQDLQTSGGKQFVFVERSTNTSFAKQNAIKYDLTSFALAFFVKMEPSATVGKQCIFSYTTLSSPNGNGLYICLSPTIQINIGNVLRTTKTKIPKDGELHHITVTWDNTAGDWQLYVNGQRNETGTGFMTGHVIPHGGTAVIGQDQDVMGGGFELMDAFGPGVVGSLNMWDKILSVCDIAKQVVECNVPHGSILGMYQF